LTAVDHDPRKVARDARKERISKNEKKQQQNITRANGNPRKMEIEKTLATTKISTASMGKFDHQLDGEKKTRGVKRKVRLNEIYFPNSYSIISRSFILRKYLWNKRKMHLLVCLRTWIVIKRKWGGSLELKKPN
jgi:hypothetical protein